MRIQELMRQRGITQDALARELGCTKQAVQIILRRDNPKLSTLERIAMVIGVPVYELFLDPKDLVRCEGPSLEVSCPHCGATMTITMPVDVK